MRWIVAFLGMFLALMAAGCVQEETVVDTMGGETTTMTATVTTEPATETTMTATVELPAADSTATTGTETTGTATADKEVPKTHNVDHGGVMHAPGSDNPTQRCAACHGKDLRGAKVASASCYDCHDQVW